MTPIRVAKVHVPVTALGPGRRVGIWLQGCSIGCRECVSQDTWPVAGVATSVHALLSEVVTALRSDVTLTGVTISGGEPLEQADAVAELCAGLRSSGATDVDILLYTGFKMLFSFKEDEFEPDQSWMYKQLRRRFRFHPDASGGSFITRIDGKLYFTTLLLVVLLVNLVARLLSARFSRNIIK